MPVEREGCARTHSGLITREIPATSFEFGEPVAGTEIGNGVRIAIAKA